MKPDKKEFAERLDRLMKAHLPPGAIEGWTLEMSRVTPLEWVFRLKPPTNGGPTYFRLKLSEMY